MQECRVHAWQWPYDPGDQLVGSNWMQEMRRALLSVGSSQEDQWEQAHRQQWLTAQPVLVRSRLEEKGSLLHHISGEARSPTSSSFGAQQKQAPAGLLGAQGTVNAAAVLLAQDFTYLLLQPQHWQCEERLHRSH